jgi:hypothetical protein
MDVFWRCEPPFTTMLLKALSTPTLVEISRLRGLSDRRVNSSVQCERMQNASEKGATVDGGTIKHSHWLEATAMRPVSRWHAEH